MEVHASVSLSESECNVLLGYLGGCSVKAMVWNPSPTLAANEGCTENVSVKKTRSLFLRVQTEDPVAGLSHARCHLHHQLHVPWRRPVTWRPGVFFVEDAVNRQLLNSLCPTRRFHHFQG